MSTHGNDKQTESSSRSLKAALSKARLVQAERNDAVADLRAAETARLDMLADEVAPIFKELPDGYDFEGVVSAGTRPRLWIDMLSFVAMAEDKRTYRFMKDTRLGRDLIFESEDIALTADKITEYLAHRVLERDRALEAQKMERVSEEEDDTATDLEKETVSLKKPQKKLDEFGDEIKEEARDDFLEEDEETPAVSHAPIVRRGYSFSGLVFSFLLGAATCFAVLAASGLGYLNF